MINQTLKNILDKSINGFIILDFNFSILFVNKFLLDSIQKSELISKNIFDVFPEIKSSRIEECIYRARDKKDSSFITYSLNKNQFPFFSKQHKEIMKQNIYIHPIKSNDTYNLILIQVTDETGNVLKEILLKEKTLKEKSLNLALQEEIAKKTEYQNLLLSKKEELEKLNSTLLKLDAEKNEFLGMVAHDLRNPLSIVHAITQDMLQQPDDIKDIQEGLLIISQATSSMIQLVNDLLDSHILEAGKLTTKSEKTNLSKLVYSRIEIQKMQAYRKRILIETKLELSHEEYILDVRTFSQVLDNYLSNAIKFSFPDKKIYIHVFEREQQIICEVQDEGPGLSEEDLSKVFKKFSRLTPKPTAGEKSNGLGLFISSKMVELAKGKVWVSSSIGNGSSFGFSLPFSLGNQNLHSNHPKEKLKILMIDDEEISQKIFSNLMYHFQHEVDLAFDTEKAIQLVEQNLYDFIFIDNHLEKEDGYSALKKLLSKNLNYSTKYILCSGDVTSLNQETFMSLGFHAAIPKDFHLETLREILEKLS